MNIYCLLQPEEACDQETLEPSNHDTLEYPTKDHIDSGSPLIWKHQHEHEQEVDRGAATFNCIQPEEPENKNDVIELLQYGEVRSSDKKGQEQSKQWGLPMIRTSDIRQSKPSGSPESSMSDIRQHKPSGPPESSMSDIRQHKPSGPPESSMSDLRQSKPSGPPESSMSDYVEKDAIKVLLLYYECILINKFEIVCSRLNTR